MAGSSLYIGTPAAVAVYNIVIKNIAFAYLPSNDIDEEQSFNMWTGEMTLDYNDWFHEINRSKYISGCPHSLTSRTKWAPNFPAEQHGIEANPLCQHGSGNLIPATGSPLINAGVNLTNKVVLDFNRNPRPATGPIDIGAYQHAPQGTSGRKRGASKAPEHCCRVTCSDSFLLLRSGVFDVPLRRMVGQPAAHSNPALGGDEISAPLP